MKYPRIITFLVGLIITALEGMEEQNAARVAALEKRIAELEKAGHGRA